MVAATLTVWLVAQAAINIGYVVGLLPVTGITLPLISSGGTSVVITLLVFGILANCARHEPEAVAALRSQGPGRFGRLMRLPAPDPYQPPKRKPRRPQGGRR
jgi:cell division protein FtsW